MTSIDADAAAVRWLLTPEAVRVQAGKVLAAGLAGGLEHFSVHQSALDQAADYVADTIRQRYPGLDVPYHSRWRHFCVDGEDRWQALAGSRAHDPIERARQRIDLAVTSVLMDAGAGADWAYEDTRTGRSLARSEGLAIAGLDMFANGGFSANPDAPLRADADALINLSQDQLGAAFQVSLDNQLEGLAGRARLLNRLGAAIGQAPGYFGAQHPRAGHLADYFLSQAPDGSLEARVILITLLDALGPIWPGRETLGGTNLGDTWRHAAAEREDGANGLVPFHKLSQWLAYSLVEPLQELGLVVTGLDRLTGLAEYRNGGLLVDFGVIAPKHDGVMGEAHVPASAIVVEWRALTVALLDDLAVRVRTKLGKAGRDMALAAILEGGTWAAGRRIAGEKRPGGGPPIAIISDGSVF